MYFNAAKIKLHIMINLAVTILNPGHSHHDHLHNMLKWTGM